MNKRIFISSTCFDLIDLRAELKYFLEQVGFKPIMSDYHNSEFETYPDKNSIETCLVNLRSCDTVILILSQRYGGNLSKVGFGDYSATHLEYLEAIKENKRILFFVRDRLESDFNIFKKSGNIDDLSWVLEKDIKIFDLLSERRKLTTGNKDNWIWTFKDIQDIKARLEFELKPEIKSIRLDHLVDTGNIPFITVSAKAELNGSESVNVDFTIDNVGNQTAIEPLFLLFKADTYKQVLHERMHDEIGGYLLKPLKPLRVGDSTELSLSSLIITPEENQNNIAHFVVEVMYKNIYGDLIADATEIIIRMLLKPELDVITRYTTKRYVNQEIYEKIISN